VAPVDCADVEHCGKQKLKPQQNYGEFCGSTKEKEIRMNAKRLIGHITLGIAALIVCAILLPTGTIAKDKGVLPLKLKGVLTVTWVDPIAQPGYGLFTDVGEGTHFGRYSNSGWLQFDQNGAVLMGEGYAIAANGDVSHWMMLGSWATLMGGTGRFDGDSGGFETVVTAGPVLNPDGTMTINYTGTGTIMFAR
jgi:hypothetical protein